MSCDHTGNSKPRDVSTADYANEIIASGVRKVAALEQEIERLRDTDARRMRKWINVHAGLQSKNAKLKKRVAQLEAAHKAAVHKVLALTGANSDLRDKVSDLTTAAVRERLAQPGCAPVPCPEPEPLVLDVTAQCSCAPYRLNLEEDAEEIADLKRQLSEGRAREGRLREQLTQANERIVQLDNRLRTIRIAVTGN